MSEEEVLLKLRRLYSKDETVKLLSQKIAELSIEKGMLQSEVDELKHNIELLNKKLVADQKKNTHDKTCEIIIELQKGMATQKVKNKKLSKEVNEWRNKYFDVLAKLSKLEC